MTVAFDAAVEFQDSTPADPMEWTHTPVGTPRGVVVLINQRASIADTVVGVTYGGVAMTRVQFAAGSGPEAVSNFCYFLGASIPTGAQTVSVDLTGTTTDYHSESITVTADGDTEVVDSGKIEIETADPQIVF